MRGAVLRLSLPAEEQAAYLDSILGQFTDDGDATGYGNDELALELDDMLAAASHLISIGQLTEAEARAVEPLDEMLAEWSGQKHLEFWMRGALFNDARWDEVRALAKKALEVLPDEARAGDDPYDV